ncbi:MAG: hypothetical protein DWQ36_09280 [Acidobacteria bacterium]|nr:MAG: hypothetical protein DWQ30_22525 [Acidobacteriota bacterium]REK08552.1 MAG: hypothetical protein DWQ36_09280 [Acidobacteriota bacterium]
MARSSSKKPAAAKPAGPAGQARETRQDGSFWGPLELSRGQAARAQIGRLRAEIHRAEDDWWVLTEELPEEGQDPEEAERELQPWEVSASEAPEAPVAGSQPHLDVRRLLIDSDSVEVRPALADRSVIVRPTARIAVAPRSSVVLYVGTPIWFEVTCDDLVLYSRPVHRPPDTWFGTFYEGELCYAARTQGRLRLANLATFPARAVTRVEIENVSAQIFEFDRVNLPVPSLALYRGERWLWTDGVRMVKADEPAYAELDIQRGAPKGVEGGVETTLVRSPRLRRGEHSRFRAFGSRALEALFG